MKECSVENKPETLKEQNNRNQGKSGAGREQENLNPREP